jgi:23S rRNA (uracil1939-C5)-methyltransferase
VDVTVRAIAAGGSGVADLPDGRVVFVPRTAPGDRARIRVAKSRGRWASGQLVRLVGPGAQRRPALCALYEVCGGCQLQHLPYSRQLEWKARIVADALERIGRLGVVAPPDVVPSPLETRYRSRVTFTLRRLGGTRVVAGFHALDRPAHVVDVGGECVLPRRELLEAWQALRARWGPGARLLPAGGSLRLTLRTEATGVSLLVEGGERGWSAAELASAVPSLVTVWHAPSRRQLRGGSNEEDGALGRAEPPHLAHGTAEGASAPSFTQVNPEGAALLVAHVVEVAGPGEGTHAVDAYCGVGDYGRGLAARGWRVTGIEIDPAACAIARAGAHPGIVFLEGRVEECLPRALPARLLVVNPPRAGLGREVVRAVLDASPARVLYVSCDPATLARDLRALAERYVLASARCFDLFPQTAHVETVVALAARRVTQGPGADS